MKTENIAPEDVIWSNNEDLLADENCLPVIGTCQISSLLSNLDSDAKHDASQQSDNSDTTDPNASIETNYIVLKDNHPASDNKSNIKNGNTLEAMLYFVCNLCPFLCTKKSKIKEHLENAHLDKPVRKLVPRLKCPACPNLFFHKMSLRSHLIHDHGVSNSDLNLIIQAVGFHANSLKKADMRTQVKAENANPVQTSSNIEASYKSLTLPKVDIPPIKEKTFSRQLLGTKNKFHSCVIPLCKVTLQSSENMQYHVSCHKDANFQCPVCSEFFNSWKPLASHLWRLHKIDMELYTCDKCSYKSVSLAKLNNIHKLIHGDVRAYSCTTCKKAFKNSKQLANHKLTHKKELEKTKFTCDVCAKTFSDKRQQKIHMTVVHEKIKPFLCNYCGYKGSSRSSLKMHIRQHTGEKPFTCDSCSYATSDHNSLRRHKWRHTGQKPYKCSYCSYACIQSSTYKVHIKTKHPGQEKDLMFTCQECQFRSVNKEMFVAHMITVHDHKPQVE